MHPVVTMKGSRFSVIEEASSTIVEDGSAVQDSLSIRSSFCCGSLVFDAVQSIRIESIHTNQKTVRSGSWNFKSKNWIPNQFEFDMNDSKSRKGIAFSDCNVLCVLSNHMNYSPYQECLFLKRSKTCIVRANATNRALACSRSWWCKNSGSNIILLSMAQMDDGRMMGGLRWSEWTMRPAHKKKKSLKNLELFFI